MLIIEECDVSGYFYLLVRVQNIVFENLIKSPQMTFDFCQMHRKIPDLYNSNFIFGLNILSITKLKIQQILLTF